MHPISEGLLMPVGAPTAYEVGQWSGRIMAVLLALAGLIKCYAILRRPGTNAKCLISLMCVLGTLFFWSVLGIAGGLTKSDTAGSVLKLVNAGAAVCLLVGAVVLGMLGLTECQETRGYKQGPAQAKWAFVCGLLLTVGLTLSMLVDTSGWFPPSIATGRPGAPLVFEDLYYRFRTPGAPWIRQETNAPQAGTELRFARQSPKMTLVVSAEKYGAAINSGHLVEHGKAKLRGAMKSAELIEEQPMTLGGLSGTRVEMRGKTQETEVLAIQWSGYINGYGYLLSAQGPLQKEPLVVQEASNLFSLFECIDLSRVTDASGAGFETNFVSARYGYRVEVVKTDWRRWQALQREFAWCDFSARREAGCYLAVVPVWLGQEAGEDALRGAMLNTMGISYPDPALGNRKSVTLPGVTGVQFDYRRYVDEVLYRYRLRILQGGGFSYLVCAWERDRPAHDTALDEALDRVRFEGSPAAPGEIQKLPSKERAARALVLNQAGMYYYEAEAKDYRRAKELFAAAYATEQQRVYFENTIMAWSFLKEPEQALAFIEEQASAHPESWKLQAYRAKFQGLVGKTNEAVAGYEKLFRDGCKNLDALTDYVRLLVTLKRYEEAKAALKRQTAAEDQLVLRLLLAEIYRESKDFAEAIRLLKEHREKTPFVPEVGHELALTYIQAGQFEWALRLCRELLKTTGPSVETYSLKGHSEVGLERYAEAKASFEQVLRLSPGDVDARKMVEQLAGRLGRGDYTEEVIPPVEIPAKLLDAPKATPEGYGKEYGAYYSNRITAVEFDKENGRKQTDFWRVHVLDSSGAAAFSSIEIPYDPLDEELYVNRVRVVDGGGNVVTGRVSQVFTTDEQDSDVVSHKKKLNVAVPGIAPGSTLEFMVTRRESGAVNETPFLSFIFSGGIPVRQSIVYVTGDASGLKFKSSPAMEPHNLGEGRYWLCEDPIVMRPEPLHPPVDEFVPMLWVGANAANWTALGKKYFASIRERLTLKAALREEARRLTANLKTEDDKITALARHVQTNYLYKGLEFGSRGRIPELPEEMARNKYGDCKDHSVMLQQMLVACGIPARLALVNTAAAVQKELPSLEQFDHMIVYVPRPGTNAFIDCTQKGAPLGKGPPHRLAKREAFILDEDDPRFERIPDGAAVASSLVSTRQVWLTNGGDVHVEEELSVDGLRGATLREDLRLMAARDQRDSLWERWKDGQAELENLIIEDLDNPAVPLRLHLFYNVRNQFHKIEGRWLGAMPALLERYYLTYKQVDRRLAPFQVKYPVEFTSKATLMGPEGWEPQIGAKTDQTIDDETFLSAHCHQETNGAELRVEFTCRQKAGDFTADQYSAFCKAVSRALALAGQSAAFEQRK